MGTVRFRLEGRSAGWKRERQFVVDLATYGLDPNGDISVTILNSLEPKLPGG